MTEEPAPRASQAPHGAHGPAPAPEVGPAPSRPPADNAAPHEPNAYEANRDLFEELDREHKAASAALDADDMDAWTAHAGRGAELYEEIARRLGWRITPPRYDEEPDHA